MKRKGALVTDEEMTEFEKDFMYELKAIAENMPFNYWPNEFKLAFYHAEKRRRREAEQYKKTLPIR